MTGDAFTPKLPPHIESFSQRRARLVPPITNTEPVFSEEHRRLVAARIDPLPEHFVDDETDFRIDPNVRRRTSWTAVELLLEDFPDPRWAVPGILAEGLNLLAGPPKLGKSWLALNIAIAIAAGGKALGSIDVDAGDCLYLGLEDPPRRIQDRIRKVLAGALPSPRLTIGIECAALPSGGLDRIRRWLDDHPARALVVVDVFARVRGRTDARADRYESDYMAAAGLKDLADDYGVAVLLVHHTRKADANDWLDTVSGTQGLAGAADAVLVLTRSRNTKQAVLKVTGRDVEEAEYALELDLSIGAWHLLDGPATDHLLGETRRRIVQLLRDSEAMTPTQIADALGLNLNTVKSSTRRMAEAGQLDTDGDGHYFAPVQPATPATAATPPDSEGFTGCIGCTDDETNQ